jgi:hypothetical protein
LFNAGGRGIQKGDGHGPAGQTQRLGKAGFEGLPLAHLVPPRRIQVRQDSSYGVKRQLSRFGPRGQPRASENRARTAMACESPETRIFSGDFNVFACLAWKLTL